MINLRPVTKQDLKDIFDWRNDVSVRKLMFDSSEFTWSGHISYWEKILNNENVLKYIIEQDGKSSGLIRLDLNESKTVGEISVFINPKFHGQGVGTLAVQELINKLKDTELIKIVAKVLPENFGSEKMLRKSGFEEGYTKFEFNY